MATFESKITSKGQLTLPAAVRKRLHLGTGDNVVFSELADGSFKLAPKNRPLSDLRGIIKAGSKISGADVAGWIEQSRGRSISTGLKKAIDKLRPRR